MDPLFFCLSPNAPIHNFSPNDPLFLFFDQTLQVKSSHFEILQLNSKTTFYYITILMINTMLYFSLNDYMTTTGKLQEM